MALTPQEPGAGVRLEISPQSFERFARHITGTLGIKMNSGKVSMLQSRLLRRLRELRLASLEEYQEYLFHSADAQEEQVQFINAITTNKTDFFREPQHFTFLTETALPEIARLHGDPASWRANIWCAGCSSGEEPYTLAMVLAEYARTHPGFDFSIFATDISTRVLQHAEAGIYDEDRIAPVSLQLRRSYFLRSKDPSKHLVRVIPELRSRVRFRRLNFMDADYGVHERFDLISFRNVMIYFDRPTQEAVISRLCRNLIRGGYLFVGHSESLAGLNVPVEPVTSATFRKPC
ncbi:MAG: protein-glutamate O-methyltransferase CheR [Verrucomicrobiota bacterium]